jgi:hypothetical protein
MRWEALGRVRAASDPYNLGVSVVEQLGYRKLCDATFAVGFLIAATADPTDTAKYFDALERAQRDIDLRPDQFLHYWTRELPEDIAALVDVRRFGQGERIVFSPCTKEMLSRLSPPARTLFGYMFPGACMASSIALGGKQCLAALRNLLG